jgi:hypothetical protein
MNEDQAGNVSAGTVDRRRPHVPRRMSAPRAGNLPDSAHGAKRFQVAPSSPMMSTFGDATGR